jgi:hypothetical protein
MREKPNPASDATQRGAQQRALSLADAPDVLVIGEIARLYRVSVHTIRKHVTLGSFRPKPSYERPFRWLKADIEADLRARRTIADDDTSAPRVRRRRRRRPVPVPPAPPPVAPAEADA